MLREIEGDIFSVDSDELSLIFGLNGIAFSWEKNYKV